MGGTVCEVQKTPAYQPVEKEQVVEEYKKTLRDIQDDLLSGYKGPRMSTYHIECIISAISGVFPVLWKNTGSSLTALQEQVISLVQENQETPYEKDRLLDLIEGILRYTPKHFIPLQSYKGGDQI